MDSESNKRFENTENAKVGLNNNFTWTKDGITCPKCNYNQSFDDPELREGMRGSFSQRREFFRQKIREKYEDRTIKELYGEFHDSQKRGFRQFDSKVNHQYRSYAVFGLTFWTLLKTQRILPAVFAYGLASYFICPENIFERNNEAKN